MSLPRKINPNVALLVALQTGTLAGLSFIIAVLVR